MAEPDHLKDRSVAEVANWYRRLAEAWNKGTPELKPALAGTFLRSWVDNRNPQAKIDFDAPLHLQSNQAIRDVQLYHRAVFLSEKKARFNGAEKWAGILPRLQGASGFARWDGKTDLSLEYESLCDIAPNVLAIARVQKFGSNADRDILGSLRGFQLKSQVLVALQKLSNGTNQVVFKSWRSSGTDRYDWNYREYLTVFNPDYRSTAEGAIRPEDQKLTVYHSNAKRLEDAGQAAPYNVGLRAWTVTDAALLRTAPIDVARKLP
jgi:hypothetical protein